jgi:hypothetical protein
LVVIGFEVLTTMLMKGTVFWDITLVTSWKWTDVSEEHNACIYRVEEKAEQETSVKASGKQRNRTIGWVSTNYTPLYPRR